MFCVQCGTRINEGEHFCTKCGTKAPEPEPVTTGAVVKPVAAPTAEPVASHAAAVTGSLDSSELQAAPASDATVHASEPPASFKMFGVEMGEHAEEHADIAPSSGDAGPVTRASSGFGAAFWFAAFILVVLGSLGFMGWKMLSSRSSGISVRVDPATVQLKAGASTTLSATVAGDPDSNVTWSVMEGAGAGFVRSTGITAGGGKVAASAEYLAPLKPGTYHVLAVSTKDKKQASSAEIVVGP